MSSMGNTLFSVQLQLIRYIYPIYLIFGVIGCCLNIILLTRRQFRTVSCCTYFIMASVTMLITLLLGTTPVIYSLGHINPFTTIVVLCRIRAYVLQCTSMMYRWCLVAACFDQYAMTSTNVRLRNFAKLRIAYRVIAVIIIVWLVLSIHALVFFDLNDGRCGIYDIGEAFFFSIYSIITGSILPVSIMIICAILIRHNLVLKRQRRRQLNIHQPNNVEHVQRRRDQQVFMMLLLHAFVYVITQTPIILFYIYTSATINISNKSASQIAIERFINCITELLVYLLPVLSFYLYTLASHTFREELIKLLHYLLRRIWINNINRINPLSNNEPIQMLA